MTERPEIRFARKSDLGQLAALCTAHAQYEKEVYNENGNEIALKASLFSELPALRCLVVELDGKLIGYTTYMRQYSTWDASFYIYMDCLFLTEQLRGK